jgi:phosphatidylethanolamine/phosphatidyl-N-methylethanolamine N-methyltransferase
MTADCVQADFFRFLRSWLAAPLRVAAVAPSGPALSRLITCEISPADAPVLELGPGTGVFTRALLARGLSESDLTLVEFGPDFARLLRLRFPAANILSIDAAAIGAAGLFAERPAGTVVSGLPLLSMPQAKVEAILAGTFSCLRPGGSFYQFTYGPRCPVPNAILDRLGLQSVQIGRTMRNIPPASVYRISRRGEGGVQSAPAVETLPV